VTIFVQINGLNTDKGSWDTPQRPECVLVQKPGRNIWKTDIGKRSTTKTITTTQNEFRLRQINVKKWLKKCLKEITLNLKYPKWGVNLHEWHRLSQSEDWYRRSGWSTSTSTSTSTQLNLQIRHVLLALQLLLSLYLSLLMIMTKKIGSLLVTYKTINTSLFVSSVITKISNLKRSGKIKINSVQAVKVRVHVKDNEGKNVNKQVKCSYESVAVNSVSVISVLIMISLTIYLLLLQQTVERNPGPTEKIKTTTIMTFNTNGLGDNLKLKRLLRKIEPIVEKGGLALLQETHIVKTDYLKILWKNKFASNCVSTNSAGVIILYSNDFEMIDSYSDNEGRILIIAIKNEDRKVIVVNTYFPNNHRQSLEFANKLYEEILRFQQNFPEFDTVYTGDINTCLSKEDCLNRNRPKIEENLSTLIQENNKVIEVADAYRQLFLTEGYTWKRGDCYSRLDHIFVSKTMVGRIKNARTDWAFEKSDHAALLVDVILEEVPMRGPGLPKINIKILEDQSVTKQIGIEIEEMMKQTDENWNPHLKLEFLKMSIRSVFANKVMEVKKSKNEDIKNLEEEINQIEELKISITQSQANGLSNNFANSAKVDNAISTLRCQLHKMRLKVSESMKFVSMANWFEYGEKSNKFFLNLNKFRQKQKLISTISNNGITKSGQKDVSEFISDFYKDLYSAKPTENDENESDFYENCPKLSEDDSKYMEEKLTMIDLQKALLTCKESAPGPDGIPYIIYKKYWNFVGKIILAAWEYSLETGKLAPSHAESAITLLPKEGKDRKEIKNWRPITLSNCDAKIITKALSNKISKTLDSIIDPAQTAYVPGRAVSDNLRTNFFMKKYCKSKNIDSVLISLDAKKAFDSVDHDYIEKTLKAYGFGDRFVKTFRLLYSDISARVLVNGFTTESFKIKRGVKQGDALSCSLFILCIDPLLRNLNNNRAITPIKIRNSENVLYKAAAYADDISIICTNNKKSIQKVFDEYGRLTKRSGLELNADKTEILVLNSDETANIKITYNGNDFIIKTVSKIKICGLQFCSSTKMEYELNIHEKINKLKTKIRAWSHRNLTMEGKSLIVKTFGISQLIYNLQAYNIEKEEIAEIEKIIFKFLWSKSDSQNGIDRIKRSIMKNDYQNGGLCITDMECLNKSLKMKQFIRASGSNHVISKIQAALTGSENLRYEYTTITEMEAISRVTQETINQITDFNRASYESSPKEEFQNETIIINEVSSINLKKYFKRKSKDLISCVLINLTKNEIHTLGDLIQAFEHENDRKLNKIMKIILAHIPKNLKSIVENYNENFNTDEDKVQHLMITHGVWVKIKDVTVKQLQIRLKIILKKVESLDVNNKLQIQTFEKEYINDFRLKCKNPKLRNIYFRLIHNDFFTYSRMKRYKMTNTDRCPRCEEVETTKHLLWECSHVINIWKIYNTFLKKLKLEHEMITKYDDVFSPGKSSAICLIKIKIIQELIQIERPKHWNDDNIKQISDKLLKIEKYNATVSKNVSKFITKWQNIQTL
jgi:exonuclease III